MTDKTNTPSPEAIVRVALERAAQAVQMCIWGNHWRHDDFGDVEPEELADVIRSFADNPAEVAAIIFAAKQLNKAGVDSLQIMSVTGHQNVQSLNPYHKHTLRAATNALDMRKKR